MLETKRAIKPLLPRQPRNRGEADKHARDGNAEQFKDVALFVMADLMRKDRFEFRFGELRDSVSNRTIFRNRPKPVKKALE